MNLQPFWKKAFFLSAVLAAAGLGGFLAVRTTSPAIGDERVAPLPAVKDQAMAEDEKAIQKTRSDYLKAFNSGDAKALAGFWAPDGEYVDANGRSLRGRGAIEKDFADFFAKEKGASLAIMPDSLRFVGPTVALENGTSRVTHAADGSSTVASYSVVHTKRDGKWLLASVRESVPTPVSNYERLRDLEWLVGNWTAKGNSHSMEMVCEWMAHRNFLSRKYSAKGADGSVKTGNQIIGWDPVIGGIRSWVFDSEGGFGTETWTKDGKRWVQECNGVARDGAPVSAVNIITQVDHDTYTWQSVQRTLNEARLPDTGVVTVNRVKSKK